MAQHRIGRQLVEIVARDPITAQSLADRTAALGPRLSEALARRFDAADDGAHRRIDRLVLTLPPCDSAAFEESLLANLDAALAEALPAQLARLDAIAPTEDALELIAFFVRSGVLPWWADDHAAAVTGAVETLLGAEPVAETPAVVALRHLLRTADAATRLVQALPSAPLPRLAAHLSGLSTEDFERLAIALTAEARNEDPVTAATRVWSALIAVAAAQVTPVANIDALADEVRIRLAFAGLLDRTRLPRADAETAPPATPARSGDRLYRPAQAVPPPQVEPLPDNALPDTGAGLDGEPGPTIDPSAQLPFLAEADPIDAIDGEETAIALPDHAMHGPSEPGRARIPDARPSAASNEPPAESSAGDIHATPLSSPAVSAAATRRANHNKPSAAPAFEPASDTPEAGQQPQASEPADAPAISPRDAPPSHANIDQRIAGEQPAEHDSLFVGAAGIILLGPFLPDYFAAAGLVDTEHRFVTPEARHRAVTLIDYLASAERDPPETRLALAKLLAGMPIDTLHAPLALNDAEAAAADALLAAALVELPMLGQLSVEGFRSAWLNRPGLLTVEHGSWLLRVERHGWDVLLERLPWSIAWLQLPWQLEGIRVEW